MVAVSVTFSEAKISDGKTNFMQSHAEQQYDMFWK